ncbi:hypothetical protein JRQ81_017617 [Phrynocephalus forsythii]|uniref:Uncharacterized protein n=1 Tax=Phrynocephalus forsythii TaxID=171643 RepID=A0A9Q1B0H7_9SAUR|nr:hypothetical protein JRQ81_017617 [Phrynocephalus forsythii]
MMHEKQAEMGRAEHVLIQDMTTRWNSTYEMVKCLVEQRGQYLGRSRSSPKEQGLGRQAVDLRGYPP